MMRRSDKVLLAVDHPRTIAALLLILLVAVLFPLPTLRFDSDINRVFLSDSPLSQAQRDFEARFDTSPSNVAILVEANSPFSIADLELTRQVALDLEFVEGTVVVSSPFALRFPPDHPDFADAPVFPADLEAGDIAARLEVFRALKTGLPTLITSQSMLIVAAVDTEILPLEQALPDIRDLARTLEGAGLHAVVTGEDVVSLAIRDGLTTDLARLNLFGALLVTFAALVLLRDPRLTVIAVVPGLLGAVATLGLAAWLNYPVTVLNNVIPVLMLVLGVANGLHLTVHLARTDGDLRDRIADTIRTVGPASGLTAITTALAFGAIMLTPNAQLFEFAVLGAVGVIVTLAVLIPGFTVLATTLAPARRDVGLSLGRVATGIGGASLRAPVIVTLVGLLALGLSTAGFVTTKAWFPLYQNLPAESDLADVNDRVAEDFGGVFRAWVEMPAGADWSDLSRAVRAVEAEAAEGSVLSELALARWLGNSATEPSADTMTLLPAVITDRLRDPETGTLRFAVAVPEPMRSPETLALFDRLETAALGAGAARMLGLPAIMRHESVALIQQLSIGLLVASVGGAVVVAASFRSLMLLPVVLVVNLLPVLAVGATLHLLTGGQLTPPAILSLTIAFGVAVDDTIHYLNRFLRARNDGQPVPSAARSALASAGGVMVMTSILLCAGLAVTGLSSFFPVRLFGAMLGLSLVVALIADLVFLPAMLCIGARHAKI